jgi:AraC family transcriptional regulator
LYSVEIYHDPDFFKDIDPSKEFEKWAAVEVTGPGFIPPGMETIILPEGPYAVFIHRGAASDGPKTYQYIFGKWLPSSEYLLDDRPHFALMGEKYKNNDPDSEEEIWIPIKKR